MHLAPLIVILTTFVYSTAAADAPTFKWKPPSELEKKLDKAVRNIVVFKDDKTYDEIKSKVKEFIGPYGSTIEQALNVTYAAGNWSEPILKLLNATGFVDYYEPDYPVQVFAPPANISIATQANPGWALDRIDQSSLPLNSKFQYPQSAGKDVNVYIIDTGVDVNNPEFEGRARWGTNTLSGADGSSQTDDNGHGTFAAGIIAGKTYGVAKNANIIAVKSLGADGAAYVSDVLRGLQWVINEHQKSSNKKTVVNLSLGSPYSRATNQAVAQANSLGLTMVVAAGNGDDNGNPENACDFSPASSSSVITVGASNQVDSVASFSNYGSCVSLLAPGVKVTSLGDGGAGVESTGGGKTGVNAVAPGFGQASGTSFAAPYVAGAVALMLAEAGPVRPDEVKRRLVDAASTGKLSGVRSGTPNALLNAYEMSFGVDNAGTSLHPATMGSLLVVAVLSAQLLL